MRWSAVVGAAALAACSQAAELRPDDRDAPPAAIDLTDSETCKTCHPKQYDAWAGSMHAHASDDPLFLALNRRAQVLGRAESFCVKCHAPMAIHADVTRDGLNLASVPKALQGVSCYYCHSVDVVLSDHNNGLHVADDGQMRGSYDDTVRTTAHGSSYSALHDQRRTDAASLCGSCHDVVNRPGAHLERTYEEWQGVVGALREPTCGACHMKQGAELEPIATVEGAKLPARRLHAHEFAAVDATLSTAQDGAQERAMQELLDTALATAVCVRGTGAGAAVLVGVAAKGSAHLWPSGSAHARRLWFEIAAYAGGAAIYESPTIADGEEPATSAASPWLFRDALFDADGNETHDFWAAAQVRSQQLSAAPIWRTFPADSQPLGAYPDRVVLRARLRSFPLDFFDVLFESPTDLGLTEEEVRAMRARLGTSRTVGEDLEWNEIAVTGAGGQTFVDATGATVRCVSRGLAYGKSRASGE